MRRISIKVDFELAMLLIAARIYRLWAPPLAAALAGDMREVPAIARLFLPELRSKLERNLERCVPNRPVRIFNPGETDGTTQVHRCDKMDLVFGGRLPCSAVRSPLSYHSRARC